MCDIRCTNCEKKLMEIDGNMQGAVLYVDCPRCKKRNMIMPKVKAKKVNTEIDESDPISQLPVTIRRHTQHYLALQTP